MPYEPNDPLLKIAEVKKLTRRSTSRIYADMNAGLFPRPIRIGARAVAWRQSELVAWVGRRIEERDQRGVG
ncbi:MAG: AlpA family phage regulatory protein [Croceibacterium sp.]